jgi:uncharacterized protein (TIGR03000 family)
MYSLILAAALGAGAETPAQCYYGPVYDVPDRSPRVVYYYYAPLANPPHHAPAGHGPDHKKPGPGKDHDRHYGPPRGDHKPHWGGWSKFSWGGPKTPGKAPGFTPPMKSGDDARIDRLERSVERLTEAVNELRKLVEGKGGPGKERPGFTPPKSRPDAPPKSRPDGPPITPPKGRPGGPPFFSPPAQKGKGKGPDFKGDKPSSRPAPAKVTVRLPADAQLYVNDDLCPLTSDTRTFPTPVLDPGVQYFYTLRMEQVRDGQVHTEVLRVLVNAGEHSQATFGGYAQAGE